MALRLRFRGEQAGPKFQRGMIRGADKVRRVTRVAASKAMDEALRRGRANISGAGKFGKRWTEGLSGEIGEGGGHTAIQFSHNVPYFSVFQEGRVIKGKPLLWIPLSFANDAQGIRARDYPGGLFRVNRLSGGAPLLFSVRDKQPKYFGKESVTIPKKFRVIEIIAETARKMRNFYRSAFKKDKG